MQDTRVINRDYAWALQGFKAVSGVLFQRGKRYTTIAGVCTTGILQPHLTLEGAATADTFFEWFASDMVSASTEDPAAPSG